MSQGTNGFDPYLKWLGIPPEQQPPDHYTLLGLPRFEADTKRIEEAARERMTRVREYHIGPHADQCQELLNEIAKAKVCLMQAKTKDPYDEKLRLSLLSGAANASSRTDAPPSPHSWSSPLPLTARPITLQNAPSPVDQLLPPLATLTTPVPNAAAAASELVRIDTGSSEKRKSATARGKASIQRARASKRTPSLRRPMRLPAVLRDSRPTLIGLIASASLLAIAVAVVAYRTWGPSPPGADKPAKTTPDLGIPITPPGPSPSDERTQAVTPEVPEPKADPAPDPIPRDAPLPANLLDLVDVKRHNVLGVWERDREEIRNVDILPYTRFVVPVVVTGSYDLTVEFSRHLGRDSLHVWLPVGNRRVVANIGGWPREGGVSGLDYVDGKRPNSNVTRTRHNFENDVRHTLIAHVRPRSDGTVKIDLDFDDRDLLTWDGTSSRLTIGSDQLMPNPSFPGFGGWNGMMSYHFLRVQPVNEDGFVPGKVERVTADNVPGFQRLDRSPHPDAIRWQGNWYLLTSEGKSLPDAMVFAREHGGRLLQVSSDEENQFLVEDLATGLVWYEMPFLGLTRQGRSLNWLTETLDVRSPGVGFQRWAHDQPEFRGEGGVAVFPDGLWHDVGTDEPWRRVCVEWGPELPLAGAGQP